MSDKLRILHLEAKKMILHAWLIASWAMGLVCAGLHYAVNPNVPFYAIAAISFLMPAANITFLLFLVKLFLKKGSMRAEAR